mmetsp:Transcript_15308/g.29426  ORF Transcript_15308/g.29426 Transcript_15308/m.29426 type:complete len:81 (-) Transcript_15308:876-1118(-)
MTVRTMCIKTGFGQSRLMTMDKVTEIARMVAQTCIFYQIFCFKCETFHCNNSKQKVSLCKRGHMNKCVCRKLSILVVVKT